jgi:hypothetical protein
MNKLNVLLMCLKPGAIYLKNLVTQHWADREVESGQPLPFSVHEQDRAMIRDAVVDAVVHAPDLIRYKEGLLKCQNLVSHLQYMLCKLSCFVVVKKDRGSSWTVITDAVSVSAR